jgi:hypothetical protein
MLAGAATPFALSIFFHAIGPSAQSAAGTPDKPALAFDQYLVNLGKVPPGRQFVGARFEFANSSKNAVTITDLEPSCGCLNPQLDKRDYEPHERGQFFVRVETPNEEPGAKEYFVNVRYNDPQPREALLTFKCVLPEKALLIRPKALVFYQFSGVASRREVVVTDFRGKRFHVSGIESSTQLVQTADGTYETDESGHPQYRFSVKVSGDVPSGQSNAFLTVHTDDPDYAKLRVPLRIVGRERVIRQTSHSSPSSATTKQ